VSYTDIIFSILLAVVIASVFFRRPHMRLAGAGCGIAAGAIQVATEWPSLSAVLGGAMMAIYVATAWAYWRAMRAQA
jgi:hypothetical protein